MGGKIKRFLCHVSFGQFHAMDTLHGTSYDMSQAIVTLVPQGGPVLCRDEMEEWSALEASLFEEALEKYGKDFTDIRQDFVSPAPSHTSSAGEPVAYFYPCFFLFWASPIERG